MASRSHHASMEEAAIAVVAGGGFCALLTWLVASGHATGWLSWASRGSGVVNGLSFIAFGLAAFELRARRRASAPDEHALRRGLLPEDAKVLVESHNIPKILEKLQSQPADVRSSRLARMIETCAHQYMKSGSVSEVGAALSAQADSEFNRLDAGFSLVRYYLWVIPSLGFIGTVLGLSGALVAFKSIGTDVDLIGKVSVELAYAFDTTFVALALASVLMFAYHRVVEMEEDLLNSMSSYCFHNFVARVYYGGK